jgi:hypothetical protein
MARSRFHFYLSQVCAAPGCKPMRLENNGCFYDLLRLRVELLSCPFISI